jgi:hypothetical protein
MEYCVISKKVSGVLESSVAKQTGEFTRMVNEQLRSGWEPVGGVAIGTAGSKNYLYQALIKRR